MRAGLLGVSRVWWWVLAGVDVVVAVCLFYRVGRWVVVSPLSLPPVGEVAGPVGVPGVLVRGCAWACAAGGALVLCVLGWAVVRLVGRCGLWGLAGAAVMVALLGVGGAVLPGPGFGWVCDEVSRVALASFCAPFVYVVRALAEVWPLALAVLVLRVVWRVAGASAGPHAGSGLGGGLS